MRKISIMSASIMFATVLLTSCSTKTTAINDLRSFANEIDKNGATYTVNDWKDAAKEYQKIDNNLKKYEYNAEQTEEISRLKGQCVGSFVRNVATNAKDKVNTAVSAAKGFVEGIKEAFKNK